MTKRLTTAAAAVMALWIALGTGFAWAESPAAPAGEAQPQQPQDPTQPAPPAPAEPVPGNAEPQPAPAPTPEPTPEQPAPAPNQPTPEPAPAEPAPAPQPAPEQPPAGTEPTPAPMPDPAAVPAEPAPTAPAEAPAETPAAAPEAEPEFPTPQQLIAKMRAQAATRAAMTRVAYFDLAQPIVEKPVDFSLTGGGGGLTLRTLVERIHLARDAKDIRAVLLTMGQPSMNIAQAQEIRDALAELRKAGKKTFVYADNYDSVSYTVATGATDVCLLEGGEIMIPGVGLEATFYKGIFDKVGVKADYVQIGEYKGADEQYTRTGPSEESKGELNRLVDAMYEQLVDGIATNRNLSKDVVRQLIDDTIVPATAAKDRGFVDHLLDVDEIRELLNTEMGNQVDLVYDFGQPRAEPIDFSNPLALMASLTKRPEPSGKPAIALIYAEGTITDGEGGTGLFGGSSVGSSMMRRALRTAAKDDNVRAVVIRIDSPGGSALASEVMWQAARHVAEKKPVIVSIGSMAASGGYYLASAGDHIFADPSAIVGSIGVVGGKFVLKDLYDKIGLTSEAFYRGKNADLFSDSKPFDDRQRRLITTWMRNTYDQFTSRVMHTRKDKIKDIDQVARGRIFLAKQAKDLGMVDEIGGIEAALAHAAAKASLQKGQYDVRVLPAPRTFADMLVGTAISQAELPFNATIEVAEDSILRTLSPRARQSIGRQLDFLHLLQDRPIVLVTPYVLTVR